MKNKVYIGWDIGGANTKICVFDSTFNIIRIECININIWSNFKELNNAVGDLVTWQENYKTILDRSHKQFSMAIESMKSSKTLLEGIASQYKENMKINEDVKVSIELLPM